MVPSEVIPSGKEQQSGTKAELSCTITGLTTQLDEVKWLKSDGTPITSGTDGYTINTGSYSEGTQTTLLTVSGEENIRDTTYKCSVSSTEHGVVNKSTIVHLKVFSKYRAYRILCY